MKYLMMASGLLMIMGAMLVLLSTHKIEKSLEERVAILEVQVSVILEEIRQK